MHDCGDGLPGQQHSIPYPPPPTPHSSLTHSLLRVLASLVPSSVPTPRRSFSLTTRPPRLVPRFRGAPHVRTTPPRTEAVVCAQKAPHTEEREGQCSRNAFKRGRRSETWQGLQCEEEGVEERCTTVSSSPLKVGNNS